MKKKIISILLTATLSLSLVGCGGGNVSEKEVEVKQGAQVGAENVLRIGRQPGDVVTTIAQEKGFFEEEGLDVEVSVFSYGPPIVEALTSGDLDVGLLGDQPAFSAISNGVDIEIFSAVGSSNHRHGLIARDDSNIESIADLKGKKVSVPVGSNAQPLLYIYLDEAGLKDTDVEIVNLGVTDAETSIIAGDIDAAVVYEPHFTSVATKENGVHVVTDAEGYKDYVTIEVTRRDYAKENPEQIAKLLRAWNKAIEWSNNNQQEAAQIVYDADGVDIATTLKYFETTDVHLNLTDTDVDAIVAGESQSFKYGLIENDFDVNEYINFEYLELAGLR